MLLVYLAALSIRQPTAAPADWLTKWEKSIVAESKDRYCDRETGEEIGWLISPFLSGFSYGYLATRDTVWIDRMVDWTDSWIARGVKEPDGCVGWPKQGTGGLLEDTLYTDSLLGEAMALRPIVLLAGEILQRPNLKAKYGEKAKSYIALAEQTFKKWNERGCWRDVKDGGVWVVPAFGIDQATGQWTSEYDKRQTDGFSNPDNKQNLIAEWLIEMYDVTKKPIYRERAMKWWQVMKSRMRLQGDGKYYVWDYWDPAGPWDYKPDGSTRHWVGVHPNGGYYAVDVSAITDAYENGLVFTKQDLERLIATNRDFMWDKNVTGATFKRIDGEAPDPRWKDSPGLLWVSLTPYDATLRNVFEANFDPASWGGLSTTPWYVWRHRDNRT
jgi:hypothetical protein